MDSPIVEIPHDSWSLPHTDSSWIRAVEAGKLLYFPALSFALESRELDLFRPDIRHRKSRNISLGVDGKIKGAAASTEECQQLQLMMTRFRRDAQQLVSSLLPVCAPCLILSATSFRPADVVGRKQSLRADDRLLHVDAFPSRPNRGMRILRVFSNVNPHGQPRVWRVGEPFEHLAQRFLPRARPYSRWQARLLHAVGITKSLRSEYDHLMLQLHDAMKADQEYQRTGPQTEIPFAPGSTWVCYSDQAAHAVKSGQYLLETTFHLLPQHQYNVSASPLGILTRLTGRQLV